MSNVSAKKHWKRVFLLLHVVLLGWLLVGSFIASLLFLAIHAGFERAKEFNEWLTR